MLYQAGDHPQEDLAKFGCRPNNTKLKILKNLFIYFGLEPLADIWPFLF